MIKRTHQSYNFQIFLCSRIINSSLRLSYFRCSQVVVSQSNCIQPMLFGALYSFKICNSDKASDKFSKIRKLSFLSGEPKSEEQYIDLLELEEPTLGNQDNEWANVFSQMEHASKSSHTIIATASLGPLNFTRFKHANNRRPWKSRYSVYWI